MKKKKKTIRQRLRYWLDLWMSKGSGSMILILFAVMGAVLLLLGLVEWISMERTGESFLAVLWNVFMHILDPGTITGDSTENGWYLFRMLIATYAGIFSLALLIGFVSETIQNKSRDLAMGREAVIEEDHTVILGFNEAAMLVLGELIEASRGRTGKAPAAVILSPADKLEMEEKIRLRFPDTENLRIVCRSGSTCSRQDLRRCALTACRSVIVCEERDFDTIKAILACTHMLNTEKGAGKGFVTAVINDSANELTARIAGYDADFLRGEGMSGTQDRLELLMIENTVSRIMAHTCRQIGLARVFDELFSFRDSECYIIREENARPDFFRMVKGKTIRQISRCLPAACAIGVVDPDGCVRIDDPDRLVLGEGCSLILLAENNEEAAITDEHPVSYGEPEAAGEAEPLSVLIIGMNSKLPFLLKELGNYLCPGSVISMASDTAEISGTVTDDLISELEDSGIHAVVRNEYRIYDYPALRVLLDNCSPDHIIILSGRQEEDDAADELSLTLLLYIQQYRRESARPQIGITCEMRSISNQVLAQQAVSSDFIISRNIAALMMAQISENRELRQVFETLLDSSGYEVYMKKAKLFFDPGQETDLFSVADAAAARGDVFIGYRRQGKSTRPVINPRKSRDGRPVTVHLSGEDELIVLSRNAGVGETLTIEQEDI